MKNEREGGRKGEGRMSLPFLLLETALAIAMFPSSAPVPLHMLFFLVVIAHFILFEIPGVLSDYLDPYLHNQKEPVVEIVPGRLGET